MQTSKPNCPPDKTIFQVERRFLGDWPATELVKRLRMAHKHSAVESRVTTP